MWIGGLTTSFMMQLPVPGDGRAAGECVAIQATSGQAKFATKSCFAIRRVHQEVYILATKDRRLLHAQGDSVALRATRRTAKGEVSCSPWGTEMDDHGLRRFADAYEMLTAEEKAAVQKIIDLMLCARSASCLPAARPRPADLPKDA